MRAGGRGDGILRWDLPRSGQARISCITDRCSRRYALVNLWLQLYLARTPLCLPWPSSCLVLPTTQPTRGTPDTCRQENIWPPIGPKIRFSSQDEECLNFTKHRASQPLLKSSQSLFYTEIQIQIQRSSSKRITCNARNMRLYVQKDL